MQGDIRIYGFFLMCRSIQSKNCLFKALKCDKNSFELLAIRLTSSSVTLSKGSVELLTVFFTVSTEIVVSVEIAGFLVFSSLVLDELKPRNEEYTVLNFKEAMLRYFIQLTAE